MEFIVLVMFDRLCFFDFCLYLIDDCRSIDVVGMGGVWIIFFWELRDCC